MRRLRQIAITSTLLVFALHPGPVLAGRVRGHISGSTDELRYVAKAGETNDVTITGSGSTYSVHDSAGLTARKDCTQVDATTATCEASRASYTSIGVITRDGNDIVHISSDTNTYAEGGSGDDRLFGDSDNAENSAVLDGARGGDRLGGGGARTYVSYYDRSGPVRVTKDGVANDGERGEGDNVLPSIAVVVGSPYNDHLTGGPGKEILGGYYGNDTISGLGGSDDLNGGPGNDLMIGGQGNDRLSGAWGNDSLKGRLGDDALHGKTGVDSLSGGVGNDKLDSVDKWADSVTCGAGTDSASVDKLDVVASDCENVTIEEPHGRAQRLASKI